MSETEHAAQVPTVDEVPVRPVAPLETLDPPKVGDFWLDARLAQAPSGIAYAAHDDDRQPVVLVLLSAGAAGDGAARDRLAGAVNALDLDTVVARGGQGQDTGRLARRFRGEDHDPVSPDAEPLAPWVALRDDGTVAASAEASRLLAVVGLDELPQQGVESGPDFELPWAHADAPGHHRLWPLPWPGRYDRAGWMTIITSWLLMLALMALAVIMAIILFQKAPEMPAPPPVPTTGTGTPPPDSSASPSPSSASPSPSSGSPSASSASPSPQEGSASPSEGTPTPKSKL